MTLDVAIVGAGWMGETHASAIAASGDRVALVIDANPERAQKLADRHDAGTSASLDAARGLDAAVIATPSFQHLDQATELVRLGVNVLVEKPHRLPGQTATRLAEVLKKSGIVMQIGMTTRFHEGIMALRQATANGELGHILSYSDSYGFQLQPDTLAHWYFDPALAGGGVTTTNGVHLLDRAAWLLEDTLTLDSVHKLRPIMADHDIEDHAELRLHGTKRGVPVTVSLLWSPYPCPEPELRVVGSRGIARIGLFNWSIEGAEDRKSGTIDRPNDAFDRQWQDFRQRLTGTGAPGTGPDLATLETTLNLISNIYAFDLNSAKSSP